MIKAFKSAVIRGFSTFNEVIIVGSGDCVAFNPVTAKYQLENCGMQLPFICQDNQKTHADLIEVMRIPTVVLPLDNVTEEASESTVGFSGSPVFQTELKSAAFFSGKNVSYIDFDNLESITTKYGLSVSMWIKAKHSLLNKRTLLELSHEEEMSLVALFIQDNLLNLKLCGDLLCNTSQILSSSIELVLDAWTFIAFTINTKQNKGTFFVNNTFGTDGSGKYFDVNLKGWFQRIPFLNKIKIGAEVFGASAFQGEISCIQILNRTLVRSQMYQLSKICHVKSTYPRGKPCPEGFHLMDHQCYKLSDAQLSYTDAIIACMSAPNNPVVTRLAFPDNFQTQENLVVLAKSLKNISQIYVGLDSMSSMFYLKIVMYLYIEH